MARMLPHMDFSLEFNDAVGLSPSGRPASPRWWNRYARESLSEELVKHHEQRIPLHFRLGAKQIYGYMPRQGSTRRKKQYVWRKPPDLDLVRTGTTSRVIMGMRQITMSGAYGGPESASQGLQGRLLMRLGFPTSRDNTEPGNVSIDQMKKEITSVTPQESGEIASGFGRRIINKLNAHYGPKHTVRLN